MPTVMLTETVDVNTIKTALTTAMTNTSNDILEVIADALPSALSVAGAILAITVGWALWRRFTKA